MFVTLFVISIVVAIMLHEFGHYATAKLFNMKVEKFFLGFGPTLWSVRRGETEYGVKALPAGGFVKIVGMNEHEAADLAPADRERTFIAQSAWKRSIVLVAGSATHFVLAALLIFAALTVVGVPDYEAPPTTTLDVVLADSPAADAGLRPGDRIVAIDGRATDDFNDVREVISSRPGEEVALTVDRGGERLEVTAMLAAEQPDGTSGGFLGVGPRPVVDRLSAAEALRRTTTGDLSVASLTRRNVEAIGQALSPSALARWFADVDAPGPRSPEGPISLLGVGQTVNALGVAGDMFNVLFLLALLNITLGTLNMLPLPPLDGGHLAVLAIEESVNGVRRLRGRAPTWRLDPSVIVPVAVAVIAFFVVVSLTALYVDITKPASQLLEQ